MRARMPGLAMVTTLVAGLSLPVGEAEAGPKSVSKCRTIDESGSYAVTKNITAVRGFDFGNGGVFVGAGSTVIDNVFRGPGDVGISATCPSTVVANTATGSSLNLSLNGVSCVNAQNAAP